MPLYIVKWDVPGTTRSRVVAVSADEEEAMRSIAVAIARGLTTPEELDVATNYRAEPLPGWGQR